MEDGASKALLRSGRSPQSDVVEDILREPQ